MSTTKSQSHLIEAVPAPAGVAPFQQGALERRSGVVNAALGRFALVRTLYVPLERKEVLKCPLSRLILPST